MTPSKRTIMPKLALPSAYSNTASAFMLAGLPQAAVSVKK
jgi:hypothetical protein